MWLYVVLSVLLILVLIEVYARFGRAGRLIRKIPGPKPLPIVGNILNYFVTLEKLFIVQRSLPKVYGDVSQIHGINIRMVHVCSPEDIEKVLSVSLGNHKDHPYKYVKDWLAQGLLLSNGKKWFQRRKMLTKTFHFNILKKFFPTFDVEADQFLQRVQEETRKDRTDLVPLMSTTTLRILCETTMGSPEEVIKTLADKYLSAMEVIGDCFAKRLGTPWLEPEPIFQLSDIGRKQTMAVKNLHSLTNSVINYRRSYLAEKNFNYFDYDDSYESTEKLAMLDLLLKNEKAGVLDQQGIREEVDNFMFAGHDTTAVTLSFMMMALANEPEIQDKIYEELCQIVDDPDRPLTTEDLNQMKYLDCCIKESLRRYPTVPIIARHIQEETVLGGYTIPANTTAFICIYDMHHRADIYPEPERFIPERFLPENCAKRHPYAYIPFSAGPRNCIGQKFAMLEMKTIMCKLLRKYRLEPITRPQDIVYKTNIVLRTTHPIYVKFCAR